MAIVPLDPGSQHGKAANGGNVTIALDDASAGDLIILAGGHASVGAAVGAVTAGYTTIVDEVSGTAFRFYVGYKFMPATPDANVVGLGSGNSQDSVGYVVRMFSGVDPANPLDTAVVVLATSGSNPDASPITTVSNGAAVVVAIGSRGEVSGGGDPPAGYGAEDHENADSDSRRCGIGIVSKIVATAGVEDPDLWGDWNSGAHVAATIALRPYIEGLVTKTVADTLAPKLDAAVSAITGTIAVTDGLAAMIVEDAAELLAITPIDKAASDTIAVLLDDQAVTVADISVIEAVAVILEPDPIVLLAELAYAPAPPHRTHAVPADKRIIAVAA